MRKRISYLLILSTLFVALFSSCEKSTPSVGNTDEFSSVPIVFSPANYTATVKGTVLDETTMTNFGVYSLINYVDNKGETTGETMLFMDNVDVNKSTTGNSTTWNTSTPYYWPQLPDKKLSFVAYAPYNADKGATKMNDEGTMTVCHSVSVNPMEHVDLCVSRVAKDKTYKDHAENPIPLVFSHTLASLTFAANYVVDKDKGNLPGDFVVMVDEIKLSNIRTTGEVTVNDEQEGEFFTWGNLSDSKTIIFSRDGNTALNRNVVPVKNDHNNNHENISYTDAFLIPQEINPEAARSADDVIIYITYSLVSGSTPVAQFATNLRVPSVELRPATKTKFAFTLDITNATVVNFTTTTVKVIGWEDSGNWDSNNDKDIDIK